MILVFPQPNPLHPPQHTATPDGVPTDFGAAGSQSEMQQVEPQVLKVIKKYDIQLLCMQHNPVSGLTCFTWSLANMVDAYV